MSERMRACAHHAYAPQSCEPRWDKGRAAEKHHVPKGPPRDDHVSCVQAESAKFLHHTKPFSMSHTAMEKPPSSGTAKQPDGVALTSGHGASVSSVRCEASVHARSVTVADSPEPEPGSPEPEPGSPEPEPKSPPLQHLPFQKLVMAEVSESCEAA